LTPFVLVAAAFSSPLRAQDPISVTSESYVPAERLEAVKPAYPFDPSDAREGWVMLSFVVTETGAVTEPMIEDSSGSRRFEESALRAIRKWRFKAALRNGEAVQQSMTRVRIRFALEGGSHGASPEFVRNYNEIQKLIKDKDLVAAGKRLDELEFAERHNFYEDAWFWWAKYVFLQSSGATDKAGMIEALQRAIGYEGEYLQPDMFVAASQNLYILYARSMDIGSAVKTLTRLKESKTARKSPDFEKTVSVLEPVNAQLLAAVAGNETLRMNGRIGQYEYWVHDLMRRSFSLVDVRGEIEAIDIRCDKGTRRYTELQPNLAWSIPESWGACGVYVKGTTDTTFAFEEYPPSRRVENALDAGAAEHSE
jgi:TonB family protein